MRPSTDTALLGGTLPRLRSRSSWPSRPLSSNPSQIGIGVLITDGEPNTKATIEETVFHFCEMSNRPRPVFNHVVGFGSGADPRMNSLFAAAGGTGTCCRLVAGVCAGTVNPCALPRRGTLNQLNLDLMVNYTNLDTAYECTGSMTATTGQDLKDALLEIADDAACTFPLEIPVDYAAGDGADEDPDATRVALQHNGWGFTAIIPPLTSNALALFTELLINGVDLSTATTFIGEGWFFANDARKAIRLTPNLCEEIKSPSVDIAETQVACLCAETGEACEVLCEDAPDFTDDECVLNSDGVLVVPGRCGTGVFECDYGIPYCVKLYGRVPEICNGVDDDCNAVVDDLYRADPAYNTDQPDDASGRQVFEWDGDRAVTDAYGLDDMHNGTGLFCGFDSVCSCPAGPTSLPEVINTGLGEWRELLSHHARSDQRSKCSCSEALSPSDSSESAPTPNSFEDDVYALDAPMCGVSSVHPKAPGAGLALFGLLLGGAGLRRARRRHLG